MLRLRYFRTDRTPLLRLGLVLFLSLSGPACPDRSIASPSIPVVFDTDFGGDIDDAWALALLLSSPELELELAIVSGPDPFGKAQILAKFLEKAGRTDVPIAIGAALEGTAGPLKDWAADYDLSRYPGKIHPDGVSTLIQTIRSSSRSVTLMVVGPASTVKEALTRDPRLLDKSRVVAMSGSVYRGYPGEFRPAAEYNVRKDPHGARSLYGSGGEVLLAPLDVAAQVRLEGSRYRKILASARPQTRTLMECYRFWAATPTVASPPDPEKGSSILYDTVAVYLAIGNRLCRIQRLRLEVTPDGFTQVSPQGDLVQVALQWKNLEAFHHFIANRLGDCSK